MLKLAGRRSRAKAMSRYVFTVPWPPGCAHRHSSRPNELLFTQLVVRSNLRHWAAEASVHSYLPMVALAELGSIGRRASNAFDELGGGIHEFALVVVWAVRPKAFRSRSPPVESYTFDRRILRQACRSRRLEASRPRRRLGGERVVVRAQINGVPRRSRGWIAIPMSSTGSV
jgi:hypothetical protein